MVSSFPPSKNALTFFVWGLGVGSDRSVGTRKFPKEMNKEPGFDLQKQIVEEVNRVLENRLAAKEETEALKKELDKAPFDGLTQEIR